MSLILIRLTLIRWIKNLFKQRETVGRSADFADPITNEFHDLQARRFQQVADGLGIVLDERLLHEHVLGEPGSWPRISAGPCGPLTWSGWLSCHG